jgi:hypothetical protein
MPTITTCQACMVRCALRQIADQSSTNDIIRISPSPFPDSAPLGNSLSAAALHSLSLS